MFVDTPAADPRRPAALLLACSLLTALMGCTGLRQWSSDVPVGDALDDVATRDVAGEIPPADAPEVRVDAAADLGGDALDARGVTDRAEAVDAVVTADLPDAPVIPTDVADVPAAFMDAVDVAASPADVVDAATVSPDAVDAPPQPTDRVDVPSVPLDVTDAAAPPDVDPGALVAPRLRGPLSGSWMSTGRVTFRWYPVSGQEATVEVCGDPRCNTVSRVVSAGAAASATVTPPLAQGTHWWRVRPTMGGVRGLQTSAAWSFVVEGRGTATAAETGPQLDPDGDGRRDLFVSAWQARSGEGEVRAWFGGGDIVQGSHRVLGGITRRGVGASLGPAGDLNGDGFPDLIFSAMTSPYELGEVLVVRGASGGYSPVILSLNTGFDDMSFGAGMAGLGDLDGDGYGDLAVSRPGFFSTDDAVVLLYFGAASGFRGWNGAGRPLPSATLRGASTPTYAWGLALAGVGDLDGDGYADLVVGAPPREGATGAGEVCVYRGGPSGVGTPLRIASPLPPPAYFGGVVEGIGDVNGDGRADFAVRGGTRFEPRVYVFYGTPAGANAVADVVLTPPSGAVNFGSPLAGVGDVDRDGWADLAVGAPHGTAAGQVFVYRGGPSGLDSSSPYALSTIESATRFGQSIGSHGDIDGDGAPDIVIGDPLHDNGAGRVWVHRGVTGGPEVMRWRALDGTTAGERFGQAL